MREEIGSKRHERKKKKKVVKAKAKRKRLVRGVDWHAWAWRYAPGILSSFAKPTKPDNFREEEGVPGNWVRVKFVEVKP